MSAGRATADELIDACFEGSDYQAAVTWHELQEECPRLAAALDATIDPAWMPKGWRDAELTPTSLASIEAQLRALRKTRVGRVVNTSGVAAALASLDDVAAPPSLWQRLREWLLAHLRRDDNDTPQWLVDWFKVLARYPSVWRIASYALAAAVVIAAAALVVNEFRAAGSMRRRRNTASLPAAPRTIQKALDLDDAMHANPSDRPGLLLKLIVTAIARRGSGTVDGSATHREIARRLPLVVEQQRATLLSLADCAERVRYAAALPSEQEIDSIVHDARLLYASLSA